MTTLRPQNLSRKQDEMNAPISDAENVEGKFRAAWSVFSQTCSEFWAPEAAYQAWFAHYLISQFGIDRVAREPIIKFADFSESQYKNQLRGGEVKLDAVVTRQPGIMMPHYANGLARSADGSSLSLLNELAVISELKVAATQADGIIYREAAKDVYKLSMLLAELPENAAKPLAFVCILDNHPRGRRFNREHFENSVLSSVPMHPSVQIIYGETGALPKIPDGNLLRPAVV